MTVKEKIRNMTDSELTDFLVLFEKEWVDDYYCRKVCPYQKGSNTCAFNEIDDCYTNDMAVVISWFLEQDYDALCRILNEYKEKSIYK